MPRYDLSVILKDINADQKTFGKNYANIEVQSSKPLEMGDYQLIRNERGLEELMQNSKGFMIKEAEAERLERSINILEWRKNRI